MLGTRQWMSKVQSTLENLPKTSASGDNLTSQYLKQILIQGKKMSQIICYIWLNRDTETARELDGYFKRGNDEELKKLLFADKPETDEYKLLLNVFQPEYLPIFHADDRNFFNFRVAIDKYEGSINDPGASDEGVLTVTIPYPLPPQLSEDETISATIYKSELEEWLNQAPDEYPYFYENNPYIPASSS